MDRYFKHIIFEGDEAPKVNIICDVLSEGLRSEFRDKHNRDTKNVVLLHCNSLPYIDYDEKTTVYSPYVPYGVEIEMLFKGGIREPSAYDEIVYMEPYPFTLGEKIRNELEEAEKIIKDNSMVSIKILFYRNTMQRSGTDDIVGIDQALKWAPDQIRKNMADMKIIDAIKYCVYCTPKDLLEVVYGGCGDLSVSISICTERFREFLAKIKRDVFCGPYGDYRFMLEDESDFAALIHTDINRLTAFCNVKGCNDILKQYVNNYIDIYQNLLLELIEKVYVKTVGDICFWDLERDIVNLKEGANIVAQLSRQKSEIFIMN